MKYKQVNHLMIKKSAKTYYRMMIIFFFIFIVISSYMFFYVFNQSTNQRNFYENRSAHLVKAQGKTIDNVFSKLEKKDITQIQEILEESNVDYKISPVFKLSSGILNTENQEGVVIYGLDENFSSMMNQEFMMNDHILYTDLNLEQMKLTVPIIQFTDQGDIVSDSSNEITYKVENINHLMNDSMIDQFFSYRIAHLPILLTTQKTFLEIIDQMFEKHTDKANDNHEAIYDLIGIDEIYIYIDDLNDLNPVVDKLRSDHYSTTYAFDSFENLSSDLSKSTALYHVILVVIIVLSSIYIVLTYKNFIKLQQKDMGILKLFGYREKEICAIYRRVLYKLLAVVFGLTCIFNIVVSYKNLWALSLVISTELVILLAIAFVIGKYSIQRMANKGMLYLLKYGKEFE